MLTGAERRRSWAHTSRPEALAGSKVSKDSGDSLASENLTPRERQSETNMPARANTGSRSSVGRCQRPRRRYSRRRTLASSRLVRKLACRREAAAMNRRAFVASLGAVLGPPLAVDAQQSAAIPRIGYLTPSSRGLAVPPASNAFRDGL